MKTDRFDLESEIMSCWNVVEDLKVLRYTMGERSISEDEIDNFILGLETIYQAKFEKMFSTFEKMVAARKIM